MTNAPHERKQHTKYLKNSRPCSDQDHRGKNEEEDGKDQLHANLISTFLCLLGALHPHEIRMGPKRVSHAGSEPVCLHQNSDQLAQVGLTGAIHQVLERLGAAFTSSHFECHQIKFIAEV